MTAITVVRNDTVNLREYRNTAFTPLQGYSAVTSIGSHNMMSGMTLQHVDEGHMQYTKFVVEGDWVLHFGATVYLLDGTVEFCAAISYGHTGTTKDDPVRVALDITFTWPHNPTPFVLTVDTGPVYSGSIGVESGWAIPPTVFTLDRTTEEQVGTTYVGATKLFVQTSMWKRDPGETGFDDGFKLKFNPNSGFPAPGEEVSDARLLPGYQYGGVWHDESTGKWARADSRQFHTADYGTWYWDGVLDPGGFWLSAKTPPTSENSLSGKWYFQPGSEHADRGYGPVAQAYVYVPKLWNRAVYRFYIKRLAAVYLAKYPHPDATYAGIDYRKYHDFANRRTGRLLGLGVWLVRALTKLQEHSNQNADAEVEELKVALFNLILAIFDRFYEYRKPFALYPNEKAPIYGFWQSGYQRKGVHPDYTCNGTSTIDCVSAWQGGLLWIGVYHFYELLEDYDLRAIPQYVQSILLLDFITRGFGSVKGVYHYFYKWKNSHPYPPPNPLPPTWSTCPAGWPAPILYTKPGYGWWIAYDEYSNSNPHNEDIQYLMAPNHSFELPALTANAIEWANRRGLLVDAKTSEIISDFAGRDVEWQLGYRRDSVADDPVKILDNSCAMLNMGTVFIVLQEAEETIPIEETVVAATSLVVGVEIIDVDTTDSAGAETVVVIVALNQVFIDTEETIPGYETVIVNRGLIRIPTNADGDPDNVVVGEAQPSYYLYRPVAVDNARIYAYETALYTGIDQDIEVIESEILSLREVVDFYLYKRVNLGHAIVTTGGLNGRPLAW